MSQQSKWTIVALLVAFGFLCGLVAMGRVAPDKAVTAFVALGFYLAKSPIFDDVRTNVTAQIASVHVGDDAPPVTKKEGKQ